MTTKLRVVAMSDEVYYAPQMLAQDLGFNADEGLEIEPVLVDTSKVPGAVTDGTVDFALCGMWQPWMYNERFGTTFRVFARLNQQVPLMLFGRTPDFDWSSLSHGTLLHQLTVACSPWCVVQGLLDAKGVDRGTMRMVDGFPPDEALTLFKAGLWDVAEVFVGDGAQAWFDDPEVFPIVDWERDLGRIPWSVYFTTEDRLDALRPQLVAFARALGRAQDWLRTHDADEVTAALEPRFPAMRAAELRTLVAHFLRTEQWPPDPVMEHESSERWRAILAEVGILAPGMPVEAFTDTSLAAEAMTGAGR
jgi:NitT/TauT family transport system substrate-binding protein